MQDVVDFVKHFKGSEEVFLNGCCYWFARILQDRFHEHGYLVDIFHDPIEGHFLARFIEDPGYKLMHPETCHDEPEVRFFLTFVEMSLSCIMRMTWKTCGLWSRMKNAVGDD